MAKLDTNAINSLERQPLPEAIKNALDMIERISFKNGAKKARLIHDIKLARRASEVCRIMYFTVLAGEGLAVTGSQWQRQYA